MLLESITLFIPLFIIINSLKYVIFSNNHNNIIINLLQFIIVNIQLNTHFKMYISDCTFDIITWLFFGISNHESLNYNKNNTIHINDMRLLIEDEDTSYKNELSDYNPVYTWINDNKLVTTIMLLTLVIFTLLLSIFFVKIFQTSSYHIIKTFFRKKNVPFMAIITQIGIISYCNITTIAISQFKYLNSDHVMLSFFACCIIIFITFGLPISIYYLLETHHTDSYTKTFQKKFGCLYLQFNKKHYKFITIILLKQFLYSILLVISLEHKLIQNSIILGINTLYLLHLIFDNPYYEEYYKKQSIIVELFTVFIISLNFIIFTDFSDNIKSIVAIIALSLQGLIMITYIGFFIYITIKKEKDKLISEFIINNDNIQIEMTHMTISTKKLKSPLIKSKSITIDVRSTDVSDWVKEEYIRDQMYNKF
jgi:hypothetical protein